MDEFTAVPPGDAAFKDSPIDPESMLENVRRIAERFFEGARGSHDWDHTLRVFRLCSRIGAKEGVNMSVLLVAAYLHDIGRCYQDASSGAVCHAEKGAEMAIPIVSALPLSEKQKQNVVHCVKSHRFRGNHEPRTAEAKVLFDADKLDAIGAVGVGRAFLFAGEVGARLHSSEIDVEKAPPYSKDDTGYREYKVKLSKIRDRILTQTGKKLANERHDFMEQFFKRFIKEYGGER
ncbi:MAG: HD domain-containing protein [Pseudomonadota bacterium]